MSETNSPERANTDPNQPYDSQKIIDRLAFAAIREQTRARRWRIGFTLFFIIYLTVVTISIFQQSGETAGAGGEPDGEKHTAVVKVSGMIASGEDGGADNVIAGLEAAFEHEDTALVILEINSPGGSPVQAAYIYNEIMRLRELHDSIPVHAVIVDMAASGGYFVAAAADQIFVNPSSLVGSIGVRMDSFGFVGMMEKIGVERRLLIAGDNKGLYDPFLPENEDEKTHLLGVLGEVHEHFIKAVRDGRGDRLVESDDVFSGLIWSGEKAIELGLVDAYGSTLSVARELELDDIVDFTPRASLLKSLASQLGISIGRSVASEFTSGMSLY